MWCYPGVVCSASVCIATIVAIPIQPRWWYPGGRLNRLDPLFGSTMLASRVTLLDDDDEDDDDYDRDVDEDDDDDDNYWCVWSQ